MIMRKVVIGLLSLFSMAYSIEIDVAFVKSQVEANHGDVGNRLLLAKHYMQQKEYTSAQKYLDEIIAINPKETKAFVLKKRLLLLLSLEKMSGNKKLSIVNALGYLNRQNAYKNLISWYEKAKQEEIYLDDKARYEVAVAYFKLGEISKSSTLLKNIKESESVTSLQHKIALAKSESLIEKGDSSVLKDYIYLLEKETDAQTVIKKLRHFVKEHPKSEEAKIALAQRLYWAGEVKKAFHTLYPVRTSSFVSKNLYANILYDMGDYTHALYYLPALIKEQKSEKERALLEKKAAFAYLHVGKEKEAKRLFEKLLKRYPKDVELRSYKNDYLKKRLLEKAIAYHKDKQMEKALDYYERYYAQSHDPKIAKEIAEIYYFSKNYKRAKPYFKAYLMQYPEDTLIRYHYSAIFEKEKAYKEAIENLEKIVKNPQAKEYNLARYHYAYDLMQTHEDRDWYKARDILTKLVFDLQKRDRGSEKDLLTFSRTLLKTAQGPIRKPTRYKDIILTEGSYKQVDPKEVFSMEKIDFISHPSSKALLRKQQKDKVTLWMGTDYVDDSSVTYYNHKVGIDNAIVFDGIRVGSELQNFSFEGTNKVFDGVGLFVKAAVGKWSFGVGFDHFEDFDMLVPRINWSPVIGEHALEIEAFYRNGAFVNYRNCMVKDEKNVYHLGLYDALLLEDLTTMTMGVDVNYFEDKNANIYASLTYPLYEVRWLDIEHRLLFNENMEYNSKIEVCSHPTDFYDSSYIKYQPKMRFENGYIEPSIAMGYAFNNKEEIYSYGLNARYTIESFVSLSMDCQQMRSSFSTEQMTFCRFNVMQEW